MTTNDCVYFWRGGCEAGKWSAAVHPDAPAVCIAELRRMGYYAVEGRTTIGPPETPPTREQLDAVLKDSAAWAGRFTRPTRNLAARRALAQG